MLETILFSATQYHMLLFPFSLSLALALIGDFDLFDQLQVNRTKESFLFMINLYCEGFWAGPQKALSDWLLKIY